MAKRFLLVCEGPSDIALFQTIGKKFDAEIVEFAPQIDATSGTYPPHGWNQVKNWCLRMGKPGTLGNPIDLFLAFRKADGLIIQLDTDIADCIEIAGSKGPKGDRHWVERAIDTWLGTRAGNPRVHYVLCKYSSETWILSTYSNYRLGFAKGTVKDYESVSNPQDLLLQIGYTRKGGALFKNFDQYMKKKYAPRVVAHLKKARARCSELDRFINLC